MKPLILFTAMTVIGLFGIIGTVEYSQAQTIMTIPEPDNFPANSREAGGGILSDGEGKYYFSESNERRHTWTEKIGEFYFPSDTYLESNPVFPKTTEKQICSFREQSVKDLINNHPNHIPSLIAPDNITPQGNDSIHAIVIDIYHSENVDYENPCTLENTIQSSNNPPLFTEKELRITLYNNATKKPYFYSTLENITQAQPIPACTNNTITLSTQTLKGDTKMCYGKNGNDMIIITKRFLGIYGVTNTITPPTTPTALNSDIVETLESYNEKKQRERDYLALLERLYLPAI